MIRPFHRSIWTARFLLKPGHSQVRLFSSCNARKNKHSLPNASPPLLNKSYKGLSNPSAFLFLAFAAILGYGAANFVTTTDSRAILDNGRLPDVKYATMSDMEKVGNYIAPS